MARNSEKNILFISVWPSYVARVQVQSLILPIKEHGTYTAMQKKKIQQFTMRIYTNIARGDSILSNTTLIGTRQ